MFPAALFEERRVLTRQGGRVRRRRFDRPVRRILLLRDRLFLKGLFFQLNRAGILAKMAAVIGRSL
jgi:hypothetical protein